MLRMSAKNRQMKCIVRELLYYKKVYPNNIDKINELIEKLNDLVKC